MKNVLITNSHFCFIPFKNKIFFGVIDTPYTLYYLGCKLEIEFEDLGRKNENS